MGMSRGAQDRRSADSACQDRVGKVFLVRPDFTRECLICGAVFEVPQATADHARSICFPEKRTLFELILRLPASQKFR
jgi:hypothetical protein